MRNAGIRNPVSGRIASGTGTDAVAVVSGHGPEIIRYCGKHVLFGEISGRMVTETVASSIAWDLTHAGVNKKVWKNKQPLHC
jgi:adenosylcobinamide amidohydrolase